ncbi:MAG: ABC transporter substrate-binding protein [Rhodovibrionaceae bacterium]|nr:ABC transporter substrate-binding protein [Rhodovibrionaceae bacterium]
MMKRLFAFAAAALVVATGANAHASDWSDTLAEAEGQTVYWNAWGGDDRINAYIDWTAERVEERHGVEVVHVKLGDTAEAVSRVLAEKQAGREEGGSVDLIWINGENFAAMKRQNLLHGPWVEDLPNFAYVDVDGKPTTTVDFTVPTDGLEAPWGMAQMVFMYETANVQDPPGSMHDLLAWAKANPGRFTYPQPPDFLGTTFLKQALIELTPDGSVLQKPVEEADFEAASAPLWPYLDELHPVMWRSGRVFPQNGPGQRRLLADNEIDFAVSFHPAEASGAIADGELPPTIRTFVLDGGTIGNTHFVAIPYNASSKAGAKVLANFLMSPEAQARKQDPEHWGDFTVLDVAELPPEAKQRFAAIDYGVATLTPEELGQPLLEPHPSWMERIELEWARRYAAGQ